MNFDWNIYFLDTRWIVSSTAACPLKPIDTNRLASGVSGFVSPTDLTGIIPIPSTNDNRLYQFTGSFFASPSFPFYWFANSNRFLAANFEYYIRFKQQGGGEYWTPKLSFERASTQYIFAYVRTGPTTFQFAEGSGIQSVSNAQLMAPAIFIGIGTTSSAMVAY